MRASTVVAFLAAFGSVGIETSVLGQCLSTTLSVQADPCLVVGEPLVAEVWITDAAGGITGAQFALEYSTSNLELVSIDPGDPPLTFELYEDVSVPGAVVYAVVQLAPGSGTYDDLVAAYVTFDVISDEGQPFIRFGECPGGTIVITDDGGNHTPQLVDAGEPVGVTMRDFADFQTCFSGTSVTATDTCACWYDYDDDTDVDRDDFDVFATSMSDPGGWFCAP